MYLTGEKGTDDRVLNEVFPAYHAVLLDAFDEKFSLAEHLGKAEVNSINVSAMERRRARLRERYVAFEAVRKVIDPEGTFHTKEVHGIIRDQ